jgi:hypothetical protein
MTSFLCSTNSPWAQRSGLIPELAVGANQELH